MPTCRHESLEYTGEQKTDDGVNVYRRCKTCGTLFIITPAGKMIAVPPVKPGQFAPTERKATT